MTRIIAGIAGGRRLAVPPKGTRPTSDRVREALFASLGHDPGLVGAAVLDLCAGTGVLGLEALSRGAAHALFVESDRRAAAVLRRNVAALGLAVYTASFVCETVRSGVNTVPLGQAEAARSLGMSHVQAMRYIILPQAIRNIMPALGNDLIALLKDTSLVSVLGVREMTQVSRLSVSTSFRYEETYFILTLFYLTLTLLLSLILQWLQRRMGMQGR